jgi:hypothetical protein
VRSSLDSSSSSPPPRICDPLSFGRLGLDADRRIAIDLLRELTLDDEELRDEARAVFGIELGDSPAKP